MLSFEVRDSGQTIQIACDSQGLDILIGALERVRSSGHLHLRAPSCGGHDLSDMTPFGKPAVGDVSITTGGD
jgi:hypothetical protein